MLTGITVGFVLCCVLLIALRRRAVKSHKAVLAILDSIKDGILAVNAYGGITCRNLQFNQLWQIPESLRTTNNDELVLAHIAGQTSHPEGFSRKISAAQAESDAGNEQVLELNDGRRIEFHSEPCRIGGRKPEVVWGFRDVTEAHNIRRRLEEAKDAAEMAARAKGEFLANMSHEIRTPMNGVLGFIDILLDTDLNPEQGEYLSIVKASAGSLLDIVNDITDFSKIEAGKLELDPIEFSLHDEIEKATKLLAVSAHQKGVEMVCDIAESAPVRAIGDGTRLRQVLTNLIGNAVKFTDHGEVVVTVEGRPLDLPQDSAVELWFAVRDTGIGIHPEDKRKIFEPFLQADGSISRQYGGTGLGLAISQRLVERMGGRIWVESEPGRGSTFRFTIPVRLTDQPGPHTLIDCDRSSIGPVVLVDANATSRRVLANYVERCGLQFHSAESVPEAMKFVASSVDPVIIADARLPGLELLAPEPHGASGSGRLILMLTTGSTPRELGRRRQFRAAASITKPLAMTELRQVILNVLSGGGNIRNKATWPAGTVEPASTGKGACSGLRILLAEDNLVNQKVAVRLLEKAGHLVRVVPNGREALAAIDQERFEVVLMDIEMPQMNGLQASAAIRERERDQGGHVPIVAMTAHAMSGDRERCLQAGMDGYLTKPIQRSELLALLSHLTAESRTEIGTPQSHSIAECCSR
jgi:signal transduction histidine kinase/CheY-like chemotaxis protein